MPSMTIRQALDLGIEHHKAGRFVEAEGIYRQILQQDPKFAEAMQLLGVLSAQTGRGDKGIELIQRAIALNPDVPAFHCNLGRVFLDHRRVEEAIAAFRQALRINPEDADALKSLGFALQTRGDADGAMEAYQKALRLKPDLADAHNNLGNLYRGKGQLEQAIASYRRAIELFPGDAGAHSNLGQALAATGRLEEAIGACRRAVQLKGDFATGHYGLGNALDHAGRLDEAIAEFQQVVRLEPNFVEAYNNLGNVLGKQKRYQEAIDAYCQALRLAPDHCAALSNLGVALWALGRMDEALAACHRAIAAKPEFADAHNSLGIVLKAMKQFDAAAAAFLEAVRLRPEFAQAHSNLANVLFDLGRVDEAIAAAREALRLNPNYPQALNNLGVALWAKGEFDPAIIAYRRAISLLGDDPAAHFNLGAALLLKGDFHEGWRENEYRLKVKEFTARARVCAQPKWDGGELHGRTILLDVEQGLGDTIQFVRYVPRVAGRGGRVILACQPELVRLMQSAPGVEQVISRDAPATFDVYYPLVSLPYAFDTDLNSIPAEVPYLRVDPVVAEIWARRLGPGDGRFRVGLAWAGHPGHARDRERSISLARLGPLASRGGVVFYSLQKGDAASQAAHPPPGMELNDFTADIADFADTAGLILQLDLVICVDTAVAHLAGALGKPVWVLLPYVPDWRWLLDREDSPWYPTMRLLRQKTRGAWETVVERAAEMLKSLADRQRQGD
jgi:tetratricopeptide (TPR) repeat protein